MKVLNAYVREGIYKDQASGREVPWKHICLAGTVPATDRDLFGDHIAAVVEFRESDFLSFYKGDIKALEGRNLEFYYDAYRHPISFREVKE